MIKITTFTILFHTHMSCW